jgi:hypothetical protein
MADEHVAREMVRCAAEVVRLVATGKLHIDRAGRGRRMRLPDGRAFVVFRDTSRDESSTAPRVTLAVWFHLRGVPPGARVRRYLFERESILNTLLYAGFDGYERKLWMVDPATSDYAGLYTWAGEDAARRYGHYITAVLRPLSVPDSVGFTIVPNASLDDFAEEASPEDDEERVRACRCASSARSAPSPPATAGTS